MNALKWIAKIQAIAQNGLSYTHDAFDKERYLELMAIASEMATACNLKLNQAEIYRTFLLEQGYATPKLDVRAFILENDQILLVKERSDHLWTLPGGWIDVYTSPSEAVIKEAKEETGFDVSVVRLLALWDKLKHDHPPQWPHVYKYFFQCKIEKDIPQTNLEIADIAFFPFTALPELSIHRVTHSQLIKLKEIVNHNLATAWD